MTVLIFSFVDNYQNALNKLETDQLYNNKLGYKDSYQESSTNKGSYKDVYNNNNNGNYQAKNTMNRDSTKDSYRNYEDNGYSNIKQSYGSKMTQPEPQDYYNQPNRGSSKPPVNNKASNSYNQPQKSSNYNYEQQSYNNNYRDQSSSSNYAK